MENASKALLMAAAILISVIILSLGVYLFVYLSDYARGVNDDVRSNQISQFNSQFLSYEGKELTFFDVITIANMAKDYNESNELKSNDLAYITVNLIGSGISGGNNFETKVGNFKINEHPGYIYSNENSGELRKYKVQVIINDTSKFVKTIIIS